MNKCNTSLLLLMLLLFAGHGQAQPSSFEPMTDPAAFRKKARQKAEDTRTIVSDFRQEKHLSFMEAPVVSQGKFRFKKPNKVRWEYTDPFQYLIVIRDEKITLRDQDRTDEHDMGSSKMFRQINDMIVSSVQGNVFDREDLEISYFQGPDRYLVVVEPKDKTMKDLLREIHLYFSMEDHSVVKVKMLESSDDATEIIFLNKKTNASVPDEAFRVAP